MHLKRWITGLIGAALLAFLILMGIRWPFYLFLFIASLAGLNEFFNITAKEIPWFLRHSSFIISFILFLVISMKQILLLPVVVFLFFAVPLIFQMLTYRSSSNKWDRDALGKAVIGPVYICLPISMIILIDFQPMGKIWILFLLAVIFANDTGAFYAGKTIGRHRLYREVSPNKTWEGAVGGLILGLIVACIFLSIDILRIHSLDMGILFLVILLSVAAQIGDLVESMIKRTYGIKDSGGILPGHGGLLDRIDGLLFAIPVLYAYMMLI
ncbi:MAG: CDP-archaeol synthase [Deltaproteobacteria bacterium]|nr:CDP-archaeol synthase [Deltaproteobacteria bacterium]